MTWKIFPESETLRTSNKKWRLIGGGGEITICVRRNRQARRIILRLRPAIGDALLTLPAWAGLDEGVVFVRERAGWLFDQIRQLPPVTQFADGATVPILDVPHVIRHDPDHSGSPVIRAGEIRVSGRPEFLRRRLIDWLKTLAKDEISPRAHVLAARLDQRVAKISVRDTRSRWGSCASNGNLSFCWRLIMAPDWVMQYVVAHEVAHLVADDHSLAFWEVVAGLNGDIEDARDWLNANGARLHRIGWA